MYHMTDANSNKKCKKNQPLVSYRNTCGNLEASFYAFIVIVVKIALILLT